jgi:hypothetical protein
VPWLEKEESAIQAPPGVKDDESGANFSRARGKTSLILPLLRERIADDM